MPVCNIVNCGIAPEVEHGIRLTNEKLTYNETASYNCLTGFFTRDEVLVKVSLVKTLRCTCYA